MRVLRRIREWMGGACTRGWSLMLLFAMGAHNAASESVLLSAATHAISASDPCWLRALDVLTLVGAAHFTAKTIYGAYRAFAGFPTRETRISAWEPSLDPRTRE